MKPAAAAAAALMLASCQMPLRTQQEEESMLMKATSPMPKVMPVPSMPKRPAAADHPAVAEHIAQFNDMAHELDRMRADNVRLQNDVQVLKHVNNELQHSVDHERVQKEQFQRYCVEMRLHALDVHAKTGMMLEAAKTAAVNETPQQLDKPSDKSIDDLEAGVAEIAAKLAPKAYTE
jgi:hypothetical protein